MPKKRSPTFKQLQGSPATSQVSGDSAATDNDSVNERLRQLRVLDSPDATRKKRELAESVNLKSVPPALNSILGVPLSTPLQAKMASRTRERLRTPGPAPPKSWLYGGMKGSNMTPVRQGRGKGRATVDSERKRPEKLCRFQRLLHAKDVDSTLPGPSSLMHMTMKTAARSWDLMDDDALSALTELPVHLRLLLLSYLGFYGPSDGIDAPSLRALTRGGYVNTLDLSGLVGWGELPLKTLNRLAKENELFSLEQVNQHYVEGVANHAFAEAWDEDNTDASPSLASCSAQMPLSFSNLTHLSLSHPPAKILWADLLGLSRHLHSLTHLSLAHWPRPTLTPNLATANMSSSNIPDVSAGGSHYYSALDQDFSEPASVLRQLSIRLSTLRWLDLEGCISWIPALAWTDLSHTKDGEDWSAISVRRGPDFATTWKSLCYIHVSQGRHPNNVHDINIVISQLGFQPSDVLPQLVKHLKASGLQSASQEESLWSSNETQRISMWARREATLRSAGRTINLQRRASGVTPCVIDLGWSREPAI